MVAMLGPGRCALPSVLSILLLAVFFPSFFSIVSADFFQPAGPYEVWRVGDVHTIQYQTTMPNYTIGLWQEVLPKNGSVRRGPVLVRVENGPDTEFKWKVQLYNFRLESSHIFFFWLKEGGPSNQGNMSARSNPSRYFTIAAADAPASSSTSAPPPATAPTDTASVSVGSSVPTSSPAPNAQSTSLTSSFANSQAPVDSNAPVPDASPNTTPGGLPVAAQAGIGVGVSVIGLACIFCAVMWHRYLRNKQQILAELAQQSHDTPPPPPPPSFQPPSRDCVADELKVSAVDFPSQNRQYPVELDMGHARAEMDTVNHRFEMSTTHQDTKGMDMRNYWRY